jgi:hypothetical protein
MARIAARTVLTVTLAPAAFAWAIVGCAAAPTASSTTTSTASSTTTTSTVSSPPARALPASAAPAAAAPVAAAAVAAAPVAAAPVAAALAPSPAPATNVPSIPAGSDTTTSPHTTPTNPPATAIVAATTDRVPHFTTPDDAMRYLAAAYNSGDEVAIRHVTTPDSRTEFEAERQWVQTFRFRDCVAMGAPYWTYNCTLDITANAPGVGPNIDATTGLVVMDEVALEVSPAARTGYYMDAVEGCGG